MYRHRHGVHVVCAVFIVLLIGSVVYDLAEHRVVDGILSIPVCVVPLGLIWTSRSLQRTVELRDGPGAGPWPTTTNSPVVSPPGGREQSTMPAWIGS